jgi:hypothetical protein
MKSIIFVVVLLVLAGLVAWQFNAQLLALKGHKQKVQVAAVSRVVSAQQQKCTQQAHARFKSLGWESQPSASFKGHYNAQFDKCFVQIENTNSSLGTVWKSATLSDAISGTTIGSYSWRGAPGQKSSDVAPYTCEVTTPGGARTDCRSEAEFRELIKDYMQ